MGPPWSSSSTCGWIWKRLLDIKEKRGSALTGAASFFVLGVKGQIRATPESRAAWATAEATASFTRGSNAAGMI